MMKHTPSPDRSWCIPQTSQVGFKLSNTCIVELPVKLLIVMNKSGMEQQVFT